MKKVTEPGCPRGRSEKRWRRSSTTVGEASGLLRVAQNEFREEHRSLWRSGLENGGRENGNCSLKGLTATIASRGNFVHGLTQMEKRVAGNAYGRERELCACLSGSETSSALVGRSGRCGRGEGDGGVRGVMLLCRPCSSARQEGGDKATSSPKAKWREQPRV